MAVASPVLERNADTKEINYTNDYRDTLLSAEEKHNSLISANYAKLINPESKPKDIINKELSVANVAEASVAVSEREVTQQKPYLVENARADADVFRADSPINRKVAGAVEVAVETTADEEENEDLRPTQTTIQYKTLGVSAVVEEGKIEVNSAKSENKSLLTKKDKIIIAVAFSVIVALFVLIIVNSVVISGITSDVSALQATLFATENTYAETLAAKNAYLDEGNIFQVVSEFANTNGMVLR